MKTPFQRKVPLIFIATSLLPFLVTISAQADSVSEASTKITRFLTVGKVYGGVTAHPHLAKFSSGIAVRVESGALCNVYVVQASSDAVEVVVDDRADDQGRSTGMNNVYLQAAEFQLGRAVLIPEMQTKAIEDLTSKREKLFLKGTYFVPAQSGTPETLSYGTLRISEDGDVHLNGSYLKEGQIDEEAPLRDDDVDCKIEL